jgi:parvulin-like peptidyl-prolyl isomerase
VTVEDMRHYYELHRDKEFSETAKAQFRVIKITAASVGGVEQARAKITDLRQQAVNQSDEDFAKTAGSINDPAFMRTQGRVGGGDGWVERGAFAITPLEDAIWKIQPGEMTDVVQAGDAFYIARLENRRDKRMRVFEDPDVQDEIYRILSQPQIAEQRERMQNKLLENAVFNPPIQFTEPDLKKISQPVLEMAMQKYPEWAGK